MEVLLTDTLVSGQLYLRSASQKLVSTPIQTLFCLLFRKRTFLLAGADTFRVYELDFSIVFKHPLADIRNKISFASESWIWISQLQIVVRHSEFISVSVFVSFHIYIRQHFKTSLEFYACDWITTSSVSHYIQINTNKQPVKRPCNPYIFTGHFWEQALVADTFASRGCPLTRVSTVAIK